MTSSERLLKEAIEQKHEAVSFGLTVFERFTVNPGDDDSVEVCRRAREFILYLRKQLEDIQRDYDRYHASVGFPSIIQKDLERMNLLGQ